MISLLLVLPAFGLMFLSDHLKLAGRRKQGKPLFLSGIAVLAAAGVTAAVNGPRFQAAPLLKAFFLLLALVSAALEYAALFSALPAGDTYLRGDRPERLVESGMYALCRHPGALWFPLFSLSLALGAANWALLAAAGLASSLNLLYVWYQDREIFPKTIPGYEEYRKSTPFLIPTARSISRAVGKETKKQDRQ